MIPFDPYEPKEGFDNEGPQDRFLILERMTNEKCTQKSVGIIWEDHLIVEAW